MDIIAILKAKSYTNKRLTNITVPGGTLNYENLTNLPRLDSSVLKGNIMLSTLGYTKFTNSEILKKFNVNADGELTYDDSPIEADVSNIDYTKLLNLPSINNKPLVGNVDITVFDNEEILKKLNVDSNGKMTYDGSPISADVDIPIESIEVNGVIQTPVDKTVSITVPTKTSELTNDNNYVDDTHTHKFVDMTDVSISNPANDDVISYDAANQRYTNKQISVSDEKVKMDNTTNAKYLSELIDKVTIQVENESLVVKTIDGLTVTTTELNTLKGMTENVKSMFSSISTGGMAFKGTKNTKADLDSITSPSNGDMYIVITDESSDSKTDTVTYVYSDIDTSWLKIGLTNVVFRDFATNPIDLSSEVTGKLPIEKVETGTLATKDDLKNYYSKDDIDGNSFASKNDLTKYYTKTDMNTELLSYAKSTDLTTHVNDTVLHITSAERTKWNSYKEFSGDYADLRNKPDIPTVSNDLTDALKQSYDDAVTKSHEHNNKADVLDKLSTSNGKLLFNGKEISSSSTQVISDNIFTDDWKATTSYKIDDVVKYKYKDYKCTTAHTSTDTFDDTKWEFVKYSELHVYSVSKSEYDSLVADGTITDDTKDLYVIDGTSSGGGSSSGGDSKAVWGSITGTLTEQVDLKNILDGKADMSHTHVVADITDFPTSLPANGGNADTLNGKSDTDFADVNHTHTEINGHTIESDVPADAVFTDTVYDDTEIRTYFNNKISNLKIPEIDDTASVSDKTWSSDKITNEITSAISSGQVDLSDYQKKTDDTLITTDKTISGSINEIKTSIETHKVDSNIHVTTDDKNKWNSYTEFSGNYEDLTNKPTIPTVTNDLTNELKTSYDEAATNSHTHDNKTVIDKFTEDSNGKVLYNGSQISPEIPESLPANGGNAMVGIPKVYWKIVDNGDNTANIYICDKKIDSDFHCWSHIDNNGNEIDYCYMPIYTGSIVDSKLRSLSGKAPINSQSGTSEITYAKANNLTSDIIWYTEVFSDRMLINLLLLLIGKSTDTQTIFGNGHYTGGSSASSNISSGTMNNNGLFYGTNGTGKGVKVFGMEHWWGNQWRRIAGWINDNGTQKIKMTYGQSDGSTVDGYNTDGTGYIVIGNSTPIGTYGGYISKMLITDNSLIPTIASGSATTYYCDGLWFNNSQVDYAYVGGNSTNASPVTGTLCSALNAASSAAGWGIGVALSCKPLAP